MGIELIAISDEAGLTSLLERAIDRQPTIHAAAIEGYVENLVANSGIWLNRKAYTCLRQLRRAKRKGDVRKIGKYKHKLYHKWLKHVGLNELEFEVFFNAL